VIDKNKMNFALKLKIGNWKFALKFSREFCFQIKMVVGVQKTVLSLSDLRPFCFPFSYN